ncbi:MAG: putative toxin-antitoxin system toxin component, PIN family [Bryobacteraceae bacterium]
MRVLCDTNILIRAHEKSRSPARLLLITLLERGHTLLMSAELTAETAKVLRTPKLMARWGLMEEDVYDYIRFLHMVAETVAADPLIRVPLRDPTDAPILQAAVAGDADIVCTRDEDFFAAETVAFCKALAIEVCTGWELAQRLGILGSFPTALN